MSEASPRALIITYYWPPSGGGGVQRWVKMTKYLRDFGVEPVIFTPEDPDYPAIDKSLVPEIPEGIEVIRLPIWEPYHFYRKITGKSKDEKIYSGFISDSSKEGLGQKLAVFIRANFFIPDARKYWIKPSVKFLSKYLKENPVDVIISTGPPHSMHLIGMGIKKATGIPWIADFRDPWTNIDFYAQMRLSDMADKKHRVLEKQVLQSADRVVTVSPSWARDMEVLSQRSVDVITNGFDPADFIEKEKLDADISLTHIGSVAVDRNAVVLWEAIEEVLNHNEDLADKFKLQLIGPVDRAVISTISNHPLLARRLEHIAWQDHETAIKSMMRSRALLLLVNDSSNADGRLPGKVFEYLGACRPILSVGPESGDILNIIQESGAGVCVPMHDKARIVKALIQILQVKDAPVLNTEYVEDFSRSGLAERYSLLIREVCSSGVPSGSDQERSGQRAKKSVVSRTLPKAMIITYYWPPAGGGGVQRWVKMTKYLRECGVEPVIYTPEDPDYPAIDESLLEDVPSDIEIVRRPIWEPYHLYRKITGKSKDAKIYSGFISDAKSETLGQKLSVFIRSNYFIPDARKFWIKPSVRFLKKYLKSNPVDIVISTGPPHSMHLIALGVKRATGIPWIADFRDPWTNIDFYQHLKLTRWADNRHRTLEQAVLQTADKVVTVSPSLVREFEQMSDRKVELITNGFDPADFLSDETLAIENSLTHVGSINSDRNPVLLWEALEEVLQSDETFALDFKLKLIGPVDHSVIYAIGQWPMLSARLDHIPWQDHDEAIESMKRSGALLLLINDSPNASGILPGKMYEYMGAGRPVISVGPDKGDVIEIILQTGAGMCASMNDKAQLIESIKEIFDIDAISAEENSYVHKFSRRSLAQRYSEIICGSILEKHNNANHEN